MKLLALLFGVLLQGDPAPAPGGDLAPAASRAPRVAVKAIRPEKAQAKNGETVRVSFDLEIPEGWHIYPAGKPPLIGGDPTTFVFDGKNVRVRGAIQEPPPKIHKDEILHYDYHEGRVTITVPVVFYKQPAGAFDLRGAIQYQICDANECREAETPFQFRLASTGGEADPDYDQYGFFGLIVLGIVGGLVSLVMPCTYPLIPITLTYFVKQGAGSRAHGLLLSTVYSLGIVLTFTGLGFLLTVLIGPDGSRVFAADPWVNIVVGALFLWFTGSLFGFYEIQLPFGLGARLAGGQRQGVGGAFILGLLFSVVTFTCTIPIAATILTVAAGQHQIAGLLAMFVYSLTMALPFFLMGLFPGLIKEIPKSGGWLQTVKVTMAWVELGLAVFYFSKADQTWQLGALNRTVVIGLWLLCSVAAAGYLLKTRRSLPRIAAALFFVAFGGYVASGITGRSLGILEIIVPPPSIHNTTLAQAKEAAQKAQKPLFVEFTGVT